MLVLTRKVGERIYIGGDVWIEVARVERGQVRLAISAPDDVAVDREEVRVRRVAERRRGGRG